MNQIFYDGILFGNGMTINLLHQLTSHIDEKYRYLLDINDFLKMMIENKLPYKQRDQVIKKIYGKKNKVTILYFQKLRLEVERFYAQNNANIEMIFGRDLFQDTNTEYDFGIIKSLFPGLYNIWFNILDDFLTENGLYELINNFYKDVNNILQNKENIYTTNFDLLADKILPTNHLHGKFISKMEQYSDVCFEIKNDSEFYFKYIWGWNGIGKLNWIYELKTISGYNKYFDFEFFFNNDIKINDLLIYGLGFQRSGYITDDILKEYPNLNTNLSGSVIDEHILIRLNGMQNNRMLKNITVAYYSEQERCYLEQVFNYYNLKNVKFINSREFIFSVMH